MDVAMTVLPVQDNSQLDLDRAEIAALINRETACFQAMDAEGWADCYVHTPENCNVGASAAFGVNVLKGWNTIKEDMLQAFGAGQTPCNMAEFRKENMQISVEGDMAWVVYDGWMRSGEGSEVESFETAIVKRTNQGWKIVYNAFAHLRESRTSPDKIALDAKGTIVWSTPTSEQALKDHPALTVSHGRVRARRTDWDKVLQDAIERAGALHSFYRHQDFMDANGSPFRVPIILGEDDTGAAIICTLEVKNGVTYLSTNGMADLERRLSVAQIVFGLSPGQIALAKRIASGESMIKAAATMEVSVNTARTHLKRIYEKTGVNTQTALVRLLLSVG